MSNFYKTNDGRFSPCEESEAEYVMVSINEYNGLRNCLRIVKDRAMQQIDKSVADDNGYRLLRADLRRYSSEVKDEFWMVTKATPYSTQMPLELAREMIIRDLRDHYHYYDFDEHDPYYYVVRRLPVFHVKDLKSLQKRCNAEFREKYPDNEMTFIYEKYLEPYGYCNNDQIIMSFSLNRISSNYAQGVYEITYWATELI